MIPVVACWLFERSPHAEELPINNEPFEDDALRW